MVNNAEFSDRLKQILDYYNLSASSFAERIGVQRSSISHILSGRNKPSLDFVMKVLSSFEEVDIYWLLNGKGSFPAKKEIKPYLSSEQFDKDSPGISNKEIDRVIILFKDGTFKNYHN